MLRQFHVNFQPLGIDHFLALRQLNVNSTSILRQFNVNSTSIIFWSRFEVDSKSILRRPASLGKAKDLLLFRCFDR